MSQIIYEQATTSGDSTKVVVLFRLNGHTFKIVGHIRNGSSDIVGQVMNQHGSFDNIFWANETSFKFTQSYVSDPFNKIQDINLGILVMTDLIEKVYS